MKLCYVVCMQLRQQKQIIGHLDAAVIVIRQMLLRGTDILIPQSVEE